MSAEHRHTARDNCGDWRAVRVRRTRVWSFSSMQECYVVADVVGTIVAHNGCKQVGDEDTVTLGKEFCMLFVTQLHNSKSRVFG
jgi:hypothetical protein